MDEPKNCGKALLKPGAKGDAKGGRIKHDLMAEPAPDNFSRRMYGIIRFYATIRTAWDVQKTSQSGFQALSKSSFDGPPNCNRDKAGGRPPRTAVGV
ncbi:hypothetical protein KM043_007285 [Ampulex compressa]|nr:hypothetical protein KM043_007285 [Ampulex compressa]